MTNEEVHKELFDRVNALGDDISISLRHGNVNKG